MWNGFKVFNRFKETGSVLLFRCDELCFVSRAFVRSFVHFVIFFVGKLESAARYKNT